MTTFVTYVTNETQTHYTFDKDPGAYKQCLTCMNLTIKYEINKERLDCADKHVPTLPNCKYHANSGLTIKEI
jgi:hypothetical protein